MQKLIHPGTFSLRGGRTLLVLLLALLCLALPLFPVYAFESEAELNELISQRDSLYAEWEQAQRDLTIIQTQRDALDQTDYQWLLDRTEEQRAEYEKVLEDIIAITQIQQSLNRNLEVSIRKYESRKERYARRIESMYKMGNKSQLEILLESPSLTAYFTTLQLMKMINDADSQELEEIRQQRDQIEAELSSTNENLQKLNAIREARQADLSAMEQDAQNYESQIDSLDAELQAQYETIQHYRTSYDAIQTDIDTMNYRIQAEKAYQEALAAQEASQAAADGGEAANSTGSGAGGWLYPCPSSSGVSSPFGYRNIPEEGINDFHTGVDFAADYGATVIAATAGTVIYAGWMEYGGNTVKIDVGGGVMTMYCHLSSFAVSVGDWVNAGDVVAYVGSTGLSTGPHLHFEVQVGGSPVDPLLYL